MGQCFLGSKSSPPIIFKDLSSLLLKTGTGCNIMSWYNMGPSPFSPTIISRCHLEGENNEVKWVEVGN